MKTNVMKSISLGALLAALLSCGRPPSEYIDRADRQMKEGNAAEAILNYRRALQAKPDLGEAHKGLGLAYVKEGELGGAYAALSRAAELLPADQEVLRSLSELALGAYLVDNRRPEAIRTKALALADRMESSAPQSPEPWRLRGLIAGTDGRAAEALDFFRRASSLANPFDPTLKLMEIQAQADSGGEKEAEAEAARLIDRDPAFGAAYDWLLARYAATNRMREAEELLRRKVAANPGNVAFGLQLASFYGHSGKPGEMAATVERATAGANGSLVEAGDFYLRLGDLDKAISYYEQTIKTDGANSAVARKRLAPVLGAKGKYKEALAQIGEIRRTDRNDIDAVRIEAELRLASGDPKDLDLAAKIFQELLVRSPVDVTAHYGLARVALNRGDLRAARQELERCIGINARHMPSVIALAGLDRRAGQWRELVVLADAILAADPKNAYGKLLRAEGLIGIKRGTEARQTMNPLLADPAYARDATLLIARSYRAERDYASAEALLRKLYQPGDRDLRPLEALSDLLSAQGKKAEVEALWKDALSRQPKSIAVDRGLAKALYLGGNQKEAIRHFESILASEPNDVESNVLLGLCLYAAGRRQEAEAWFQKASALPQADKSTIDGTIGYLLQYDDNGPAAEVYYRRILAREPDNHSALNNLAYHLAASGGNLDEAVQLAKRAAALKRENLYYQDTLGFVTLKSGNAKDAERQFATLIKKSPQDPYFRYHRALALNTLGRRAEAREEFTAALSRAQTAEFRERVRKELQVSE